MLNRRAFLLSSAGFILQVNNAELFGRNSQAHAFPGSANLNPHHAQLVADVQASLRNDIALGRLGADACVSLKCPICRFPMTISATTIH